MADLRLTPAEVEDLERLLPEDDDLAKVLSDWRVLVAELAEADNKLSWLRTWEATEEAQDPIKANRVLLMREEIMALCDERLQERKHAARKAETRAAESETELAVLKSERERVVEKVRELREKWQVKTAVRQIPGYLRKVDAADEILAILEQHGEPPR